MEQIWWLDASGRVYGGAEAANAAVSAALGTRLPLRVYRIPGMRSSTGRHLSVGRRPSLPIPGQDPVLRIASGRLLTAVANSQPIIRPTVPADLDAISEIYAHHVRTGVATFEVDPPDASEWEKRFGAVIDSGLPFISAEMDGVIAGYAYCVPWKSRPAYRHTVEDSIYLAPRRRRRWRRRSPARCPTGALRRCGCSAGHRRHRGRQRRRFTCVAPQSRVRRCGQVVRRSASNTAGGWTPCCFSGPSTQPVGDVGEGRVVVAVIRRCSGIPRRCAWLRTSCRRGSGETST